MLRMGSASERLMLIFGIVMVVIAAGTTHAELLQAGVAASGWEVLKSTPSGLELRWSAPDIEARPVEREGLTYWRLSMEHGATALPEGAPDIPVARALIRVPEHGGISVSFSHTAGASINLRDAGIHRIAPRLKRVPKTAAATSEDGWLIDEAAYRQSPFGLGTARVERMGTARGTALAAVQVNPIAYDAALGTVRCARSITVSISFESPLQVLDTRFALGAAKPQFTGHILNGDLSRDPVQLPATYLIVVDDALFDAILPLAQWKQEKGYVVVTTRTSDIPGGATANNIKAYIQNAYDNWDVPPMFVLLVGDSNTIPAFNGTGYQSPKTDLYYGCVDGTDYLPDLYVGRFSMRTVEDVASTVEKTMDYEQAIWTQGTVWTGKEYFISSDDWNYHGVTEGTHSYCMAKARSNGVVCDSLWGFYDTGTPIATAVNEGRAMVTYSGHGVENQWQGPTFSNWNVGQLTNLDRYPIVLSFACLTGSFTYTWDPCFMENWLRQNNKAAVASYGSSVSSFWPDDDYLQRRMWDALFDDTYNWMGGFTLEGKMRYALWEPNSFYERGYFEQYNLFGDPSLLMYTLEPSVLAAVMPGSVPSGGPQEIDITVTDSRAPVEGALVGLFKDGEVQAAAYTDMTGLASLSVTPVTMGQITVTVTAYNMVALVDSISVEAGDMEPPTAPATVILSPEGLLSWSASSDNTGVLGYRIYRATRPYFDPSALTPIRETSDTSSSFPENVGDPETSFFFFVRAFDAADNESDPSPVVGEHDYAIPAMP